MTKSHKRQPKERRLSDEDRLFIQEHAEHGTLDNGVPWVAVPNKKGRDAFNVEEIVEALTGDKPEVIIKVSVDG